MNTSEEKNLCLLSSSSWPYHFLCIGVINYSILKVQCKSKLCNFFILLFDTTLNSLCS